MPYAGKTIEGNEAVRKELKLWFGLKIEEDLLAKVEKISITHSTFADPGPDWNEVTFYDKDGGQLGTWRQTGY